MTNPIADQLEEMADRQRAIADVEYDKVKVAYALGQAIGLDRAAIVVRVETARRGMEHCYG